MARQQEDPALPRLRQTGQQLDLLWISGRHAAQTRCLIAAGTDVRSRSYGETLYMLPRLLLEQFQSGETIAINRLYRYLLACSLPPAILFPKTTED